MNTACIKPITKLANESHFAPCVYEKKLEQDAEELVREIRRELHVITGVVEKNKKSYYRSVQLHSHLITFNEHREWLEKNWSTYGDVFANPWEIDPSTIQPRLELVDKRQQHNIFRIARLTWSLPYSRGYGRRLDYLLWDDSRGKLMGILGLQSAPITLPARDKKFNIPRDQKIELVNQTMDAYTLGALPPYNDLLGGKLVVLASASQDVRKDYERRYQGQTTEMWNRILPADLIAVTTLSAFGRSSLYNRVSKGLNGKQNLWATVSLGPCEGWGTLHFSDHLYRKMKSFHKELFPEKPLRGFGTGPKIRQQVTNRVLRILCLPKNFARHNIGREVFVISHVKNLEKVLSGSGEKPLYNDQPFWDLSNFWKERYCLPRAAGRCSLEGKNTIARALGVDAVVY